MSMAECKQAVLVEKETAHRDCLTGCYDRMTIQHLVDLCFLKSVLSCLARSVFWT